MADDIVGGWVIDAEVRVSIGMERANDAFSAGELEQCVVELEELLDAHPHHVAALTLLGDATLALDDAEGAVEIYEHALRAGADNADVMSGLALARFCACQIQGAVEAAREAVRLEPDLAEAHYTLALALERTGNGDGSRISAEAATAFAAANRLAPDRYALPADPERIDWPALIDEAFAAVPETVQLLWSGVPLRLEPLPELSELRAQRPPMPPLLRGLFIGEPTEEDDDNARPEALRVFVANLAKLGSPEAITTAIAELLISEAMEWFGVGPDELGV